MEAFWKFSVVAIRASHVMSTFSFPIFSLSYPYHHCLLSYHCVLSSLFVLVSSSFPISGAPHLPPISDSHPTSIPAVAPLLSPIYDSFLTHQSHTYDSLLLRTTLLTHFIYLVFTRTALLDIYINTVVYTIVL